MNLTYVLTVLLVSCLILQASSLRASLRRSSKMKSREENLKCTEFNDSIDSKVMLHVPCSFIRLMEHLKRCDIETFQEAFLAASNFNKTGFI